VPSWLALRTRLTYHPAWLLMFSALVGGWCAGLLFDGDTQGVAVLALASMYALAATAYYRRDRDTSSLLCALGLTLSAGGAASILPRPAPPLVLAPGTAAL